ncbi:hypothetical protein Rhopal_005457-T1 [Rhodotorula paludigena]|uniref:SPO22-domain-containing protein n=1 Tax=Rhodotorula paludigena TaxID=86838 RepID=A0AAV5GST3_9BASI|nr:hypothetical protein Rhopal_005457-T1 [Rhodotorula paludigena]
MAATPRKRAKHDAAPTRTFAEALARVRAQAAFVEQTVALAPGDAAEVQRELSVLNERITALEKAIDQSNGEEGELAGWKDDLDAVGTSLWNRSTALKHVHDGQRDDKTWLAPFAALRLVGYRLIRIGAVEPLSDVDCLSHLSLAVKTASALLACDRVAPVESLLPECAKIAAEVEQRTASGAADRVKALLAYYCFRIRFSLVNDNVALAHWAVHKSQDLLEHNDIPHRDTISCVKSFMSIAAAELGRSAAGSDGEGAEMQPVGDMLEWTLALLEAVPGDEVVALKLLVQLAKASPQDSSKTEEAVRQLVELDASPRAHRLLLKLIIGRNGADDEVQQTFRAAVHNVIELEDAALLLATLEALPQSRRQLRFSLWQVAAQQPASDLRATDAVLGCMILNAVVQASEQDKDEIEQLFSSIAAKYPNFRLSIAEAFTCATQLRRFGDKASQDKRHCEAAGWYFLSAHSVLSALPLDTHAKSIRKAALCFVHAGMSDRVEEVMQCIRVEDEQAKDHFLRFCARLQEPTKGESLAPVTWAFKLVSERDDKAMATAILTMLHELAKSASVAIGLDYMVLTRTKNVEVVLSQLKSGLQLATRLVETHEGAVSLGKEVTWLYKTAFNICVECSEGWTTEITTAFFEVAAHLGSLAEVAGIKVEKTRLWTCKIAVIAGKYANAQDLADQDTVAYESLLSEVDGFLDAYTAAPAGSAPVEKVQQLLEVAYSAKVEALVFEESQRDVPLTIIKLIVDKVTQSALCAHQHVSTILRKALAILYSRQDVDVYVAGRHESTIVFSLVRMRNVDQALDYVKNAAHFVQQHTDEYPEEEANWMLSLAWDEGLDAFSAHQPARGADWCETSLTIAEAMRADIVKTLNDRLDELKKRYSEPEEIPLV